MGKFLVDTNILIWHFRDQREATNFLLESRPCLSHIVFAELLQGAKDKKELGTIKKFCSMFPLLPVNDVVSSTMISLIEKFSLSSGLRITDALIAATAIEEGLTLVTSNTKHFSFIPRLKLLDWDKV